MMKKIAVLLASSFAAVSAFAAPLEVIINSNGTYDFRVNETGYLKLEFAFNQSLHPVNAFAGYFYYNRPGSDVSIHVSVPHIVELEAGETFGVWASGVRDVYRGYEWYTLETNGLDPWSYGNVDYFMYDRLTITDTQITGTTDFMYSFDGDYGIVRENRTATFTLTWSPDSTFSAGNTNGQPLPGVAVALVLGAGAYVARRRRNRQA